MKKYLIKYTLEFFVIVTGISLSFWINEWDNNRMNSDKESYFLNGLKNDLEKQLYSLNNFDEFSNQTIQIGASILEYYSINKSLSLWKEIIAVLLNPISMNDVFPVKFKFFL